MGRGCLRYMMNWNRLSGGVFKIYDEPHGSGEDSRIGPMGGGCLRYMIAGIAK